MQALFFVNFKCAYEQKYYLRKTTCVHMRICPYDDMQKHIRRGGEYASAQLACMRLDGYLFLTI